jgi:ribosomal RNA-processing protein 9
MVDRFFINDKKRKRKEEEDVKNSDDEDFLGHGGIEDMNLQASEGEESEEEIETAAQKRLRLAKRYLGKIQSQAAGVEGEIDAEEIDKELIASRLQQDVLEESGKVYKNIADKYMDKEYTEDDIRNVHPGKKGHKLTVTSVTIASIPERGVQTNTPETYIYSASKDGSIIKWDFWTGKRLHVFEGGLKPTNKLKKYLGTVKLKEQVGHNDIVYALAASYDGKYIASGGKDKLINIWSVSEDKHLKAFIQHRDSVTSLAFRKGSNQLYSASMDRTIKLWNVDELAYIETLFGHQDNITAIDTLQRERCVTSGARDRTVRMWKILEESQLVYRAGSGNNTGEEVEGSFKKDTKKARPYGGSLDAVALIDEDHFVSGSDSGAISLWNINKKKPYYTRLYCHGKGRIISSVEEDDTTKENRTLYCNWIISLASVPYSDLFASGSCDGKIKLWKVAENMKSFSPVTTIPMDGFINSIRFVLTPNPEVQNSKDPEVLLRKDNELVHMVVGVGQEHKYGRWWNLKGIKNRVCVISL